MTNIIFIRLRGKVSIKSLAIDFNSIFLFHINILSIFVTQRYNEAIHNKDYSVVKTFSCLD